MLTIKKKLDDTDLIKVFDKNRNPFLISFENFKIGLKDQKLEQKSVKKPVTKPVTKPK